MRSQSRECLCWVPWVRNPPSITMYTYARRLTCIWLESNWAQSWSLTRSKIQTCLSSVASAPSSRFYTSKTIFWQIWQVACEVYQDLSRSTFTVTSWVAWTASKNAHSSASSTLKLIGSVDLRAYKTVKGSKSSTWVTSQLEILNSLSMSTLLQRFQILWRC